jgi:ADP-heptose:LPS heptosyltransferase
MSLLHPRPPVRRVCVVRLGGMGDILLATPAARALHRFLDGGPGGAGGAPEIDFIVGKNLRDTLSGIPYLREILEFDKNGADAGPLRFGAFLRGLRRRRYDLFVNFHPSAKTFLMAAASGAPRVIMFRKDRRRQPDTGRVRHAVDDFTKELRPLGIARVDDRSLDFSIPDAARRETRDLLRGEGIGDGEPLVVVNPAATRDINRWPPDKFVALLDALAGEAPALRLALSGGPGDEPLAAGIAAATRAPVVNLAGRVGLKGLGALLERADVVVSADTGPMHIASAVGAPLVVLSGAADPDRTGPLRPRDLVVINRDLSCVPCQGRTCARGDIACMRDLPVAWVADAVKRQLAAAARRPAAPAPAPRKLAGARGGAS